MEKPLHKIDHSNTKLVCGNHKDLVELHIVHTNKQKITVRGNQQ